MTTLEIGKKLVELCSQGKAHECMETLYSPDIVSIEAASTPNMPAEQKGIQAVRAKAKWWNDNHIVHSAKAEGPWPMGDRFIVRFAFDVTAKHMGNKRFQMEEAALYTVKNDKIVKEEFFYTT